MHLAQALCRLLVTCSTDESRKRPLGSCPDPVVPTQCWSALQGLLEFRCVRPLRTVYSMLEELGGLQMLDDSLMEVATAEIVAGGPC